jgi:hypothetical protein
MCSGLGLKTHLEDTGVDGKFIAAFTKILPTYVIPNRINAVHTLISHFCDIFLDIIHPSVSRSLHFIINLCRFCTSPSALHLNKYTLFVAN